MLTQLTTLTLSTLAALTTAAGCVGEVGGAEASRSRNPSTSDSESQADGECQKLETPITIRAASDFDKLPATCWDLFAKLRIEGAAITSIARLGKLTAVNDLEIVDTGLTSLDVAQPFEVWGTVLVTGNAKLTSLDKLRPQDADDLTTAYTIRSNASLASLAGIGYAKAVEGELRVTDNARLGVIDLGELTAAGAVTIAGNGATSLDLGSLQQVGRLEISNNAQLASIVGAAAPTIGGDLVVRGNRALASLGAWSAVGRVQGSLTIDDNDALADLGGFASMQFVTGAVAITNNALLSNVDAVSHLRGIGQSVVVTGNTNLSNCRAMEIDHCVPSGAVTFSNNKPNTGGSNCPACWCE